MKKEKVILCFTWLLTILAIIIGVPKNRRREAHVIFLFKQVLTWGFGFIVAQKGLIRYPYRLLPKASNTSFTFEFLVFPAFCIFFNLNYPKHGGLIRKVIHYSFYSSLITIIEVVLEKHTQLIKYIHWRWYWTWITIYISFFISQVYYRWFFGKKKAAQSQE